MTAKAYVVGVLVRIYGAASSPSIKPLNLAWGLSAVDVFSAPASGLTSHGNAYCDFGEPFEAATYEDAERAAQAYAAVLRKRFSVGGCR